MSMNCWALHPDVFPVIGEAFREFLAEKGSDPKAECFLPFAVNSAIMRGTAQVRLLKTTGRWFGVTYKEERPQVEASIRGLVGRGEYPEKLC